MSESSQFAAGVQQPAFGPSLEGRYLRGPDGLDDSDASRILAARGGRVVVWAGERSSGKTTLSCELYERQRRPGSPVRFTGSETLLAFEERAHPSRASSGRRIRETRRTERDPEGRDILHLALAKGQQPTVNLLIGDLPGELFREIRDNSIDPREVPLLARADRLALIADGAMIASPSRRSSVSSNLRQMMMRLQNAGLPEAQTELALIVTKWDQVDVDARASAYWTQREQDLIDELRTMDSRAVVIRVAARPASSWQGSDNMNELRDWLMGPLRISADPRLAGYRTERVQRLRLPRYLNRI